MIIRVSNPQPTVTIQEAGKYKGDQVELQVNSTHIQWRYVGGTTWTNLVALSDITGATGNGISEVALTNTNGKIKTYTITFTDETTTTFSVVDGSDGKDFTYEDFTPEQLEALKVKGDTGRGIASIDLTNTNGKIKTYTITFTDDTTTTFTVVDGNDGSSPVITFVGTTIYVNGVAGPDLKGDTGKSQYQSYLDTTTDNPPLSEAEWSAGVSNKYIYINYPRVSFGGTIGNWSRASYSDRGLLLADNTGVSDVNLLVGLTLSYATSIYIAEYKCKLVKINERMNTSNFGIAIMKATYNFIVGSLQNQQLLYYKITSTWLIEESINSDEIIYPGEVIVLFHLPYVSTVSHGSILIQLQRIV